MTLVGLFFFSSLSPTASCPLPCRPLGPGLFGRCDPLSLAKWHLPPVPSAQAGIRFFQETLSAHLGLAKKVIGVGGDGMRLPLKLIWSMSLAVLSHSVVSHPLLPPGLYPTRLLCPWDFPGKNTESGLPFSPPILLLLPCK